MTEELLNTIIVGAPNFVGFAIALFIMWLHSRQQNDLIKLLIEKWSECEDDTERSKIAQKGGNLQEISK